MTLETELKQNSIFVHVHEWGMPLCGNSLEKLANEMVKQNKYEPVAVPCRKVIIKFNAIFY